MWEGENALVTGTSQPLSILGLHHSDFVSIKDMERTAAPQTRILIFKPILLTSHGRSYLQSVFDER